MRRTWVVYAVLALFLGLLLLGVAFTRFPQAEIFVRAEELPRIGPKLAELRRLYLPEEEGPAAAVASSDDSGSRVGEGAPGSGTAVGSSDRLDLPGASLTPKTDRTVWLAPGEVLRASPNGGAAKVREVDAFTEVPILDRRRRWLRVRYGGGDGWVLPPERGPGEPPLGREPTPPRPLPSRPPDPERLARALRQLGGAGRAVELGPYAAHTDVTDPGLLAYLGRVAASVEPVYRERYRQPPVGEAREAVVIFAREEDYRSVQESEQRLRRLPAGGHAGHGLVALWVGDRPRDEVASTLTHELVHMLNRRALGPALPPWLDEGLADDLAASGIGPLGRLDPARLGGMVMRSGDRITYSGAKAAARQLVEARESGDLPRLRRLVGLDWESFVRSDRRDLHYPLSAFWVRYLIVGDDGTLTADFRRFLALVAAGRPATGDALIEALGRSWDSLQWGFERWLEGVAVREAGYEAGSEARSAAGDGPTRDSSSRQTSSPSA